MKILNVGNLPWQNWQMLVARKFVNLRDKKNREKNIFL